MGIDQNNLYTQMQKSAYSAGTSNHLEHNNNPDYWSILLQDLHIESRWKDRTALDFGCGKGRNISNLHKLCYWKRVDGVDISESNIDYCKSNYQLSSNWYCNNGVDLADLKSNEYDFVMSTITLQHIPVYDIRFSLLKEIYRVLSSNGILSFQMGFDHQVITNKAISNYYENSYNASGTNSDHDVSVIDKNQIINDLLSIGYKDISTTIRPSYSDDQHKEWIYVRCFK